jgi:Na+/H+ antiporter NhaA
MLYSPLDQFKIAPLFTLEFAGIDLSVSNFLVVSLLTLAVIQSFVFLMKDSSTQSFFVIPSGWQN